MVSARHLDTQVEQYKEQMTKQGYIFLQQIPSGFDHLAFLQRFGRLLPQYDGQLVWSIKADPRFDEIYHSLNTKPLFPHTECYEFPGLPNKFQALWCVTPPTDVQGGETTLADFYQFWKSLSPVEQEILQKEFDFQSSAGIRASNLGAIARHPVYQTTEASEPIV